MKKLQQGFTLVEIMIVVAIIGLLAAIAIPNFMKSRETSQKNACINNLRLIDAAKEQWALENNKSTEDGCEGTDVAPYMKGDVMPTCPSDKTAAYTVNDIGTPPACTAGKIGHTLTADGEGGEGGGGGGEPVEPE